MRWWQPVPVIAWAFSLMEDCRRRRSLPGAPDLLLGTGGDGHTHPGATRPFGMVQMSPSNGVRDRWTHCSGYHFGSRTFAGLTHTALSGTGLGDMGDLLARPTAGDGSLDHRKECAVPGYYGLEVSRTCLVEATATKRVGFTRMHGECGVELDARWGQNSKTIAASLVPTKGGFVVGWRRSEGFGRRRRGEARAKRTVYFACDPRGATVRSKDEATVVVEAVGGVVLACALSATSVDGALANLRAEAGTEFETVIADAKEEWDRLLFDDFQLRARVGATESTLRTALYRSLLVPNVVSDVDGRPPEPFVGPNGTYYSTLSTWDTFRGAQPWLTLFRPDVARDVAASMVAWATRARRLPKWLLWTSETDTMIAYHGVSIVADAVLKGLVGGASALAAIVATADDVARAEPVSRYHTALRPAPSTLLEAVSTGLEIAVDDACAARALRHSNEHHDAAARFERRAKMYRAYFDNETKYFRSASSAQLPFDPLEFHYANRPGAHDFTEGSPLQYLFVPGLVDPRGLGDLIGGRVAFKRRLDALFDPANLRRQSGARDVTACVGQYCHGNEIVHHVPYLYNAIRMPWLAQFRIDDLLVKRRLYASGPEGLPGNDDCGQISAWLLMNALGFYSADPCSGRWELGRPLVDHATITLRGTGGDPAVLRIVAHDQAPRNPYVRAVRLDGRLLRRTHLFHDELIRGPLLEFFMVSQPPFKARDTARRGRPSNDTPMPPPTDRPTDFL
ncbi:hypothetical protein CTAYLR_006779 [Chrysophaeum taylorii]|uniref:Glycoside hydrolase family 92 protein n=1 Tax=Chrysophaeum taylorii TaxID=2483200 RepID=A0AAD7U6Z0_9STRA|nr:hypothetical protein CTAYLR_006779 [Chrysophaeum taylorii]